MYIMKQYKSNHTIATPRNTFHNAMSHPAILSTRLTVAPVTHGLMNGLKALGLAGVLGLAATPARAQDGAAIFKQNCTACHKLGARMVGPDLTGVTERQSGEWLRKYIRGSQAMIKSGDKDAVAIYEEYNKTLMPDFPFADAEMNALLEFLAGTAKPAAAAATEAPPEEEKPIVFTAADVERGRFMFQHRLSGGGASCITCHNVDAPGVVPGGLLAKDLTNVYGRMGQAGVAGILGAPPFPAMAAAYGGGMALTDDEVHALTAFLQSANNGTTPATPRGQKAMLGWGLGGMAAILLLVAILWHNRLRRSVRHDIDARQLRTI